MEAGESSTLAMAERPSSKPKQETKQGHDTVERQGQKKPNKKKGLLKIMEGLKICRGSNEKSGKQLFQYDSTSYALNFDDGINKDDDVAYPSFYARFANPRGNGSGTGVTKETN